TTYRKATSRSAGEPVLESSSATNGSPYASKRRGSLTPFFFSLRIFPVIFHVACASPVFLHAQALRSFLKGSESFFLNENRGGARYILLTTASLISPTRAPFISRSKRQRLSNASSLSR